MDRQALEQIVVNFIKIAMRGNLGHQYTYSIMFSNKPDEGRKVAAEAQRQMEAEGEDIVWNPLEKGVR